MRLLVDIAERSPRRIAVPRSDDRRAGDRPPARLPPPAGHAPVPRRPVPRRGRRRAPGMPDDRLGRLREARLRRDPRGRRGLTSRSRAGEGLRSQTSGRLLQRSASGSSTTSSSFSPPLPRRPWTTSATCRWRSVRIARESAPRPAATDARGTCRPPREDRRGTSPPTRSASSRYRALGGWAQGFRTCDLSRVRRSGLLLSAAPRAGPPGHAAHRVAVARRLCLLLPLAASTLLSPEPASDRNRRCRIIA